MLNCVYLWLRNMSTIQIRTNENTFAQSAWQTVKITQYILAGNIGKRAAATRAESVVTSKSWMAIVREDNFTRRTYSARAIISIGAVFATNNASAYCAIRTRIRVTFVVHDNSRFCCRCTRDRKRCTRNNPLVMETAIVITKEKKQGAAMIRFKK